MTFSMYRAVLESLRIFSNRELQEKMWLGLDPSVQASFVEEFEILFTDSGLGHALGKGNTGYSLEIQKGLNDLGALLQEVDGNRDPESIIGDPAMDRVRLLSSELLLRLENEPQVSAVEKSTLMGLCNHSNPGPWMALAKGRDHTDGHVIKTPKRDIHVQGATWPELDLMAAARTAIPKLLAEIERLSLIAGKHEGPR